jgi:hypothetical protein
MTLRLATLAMVLLSAIHWRGGKTPDGLPVAYSVILTLSAIHSVSTTRERWPGTLLRT